MARDLVVKEGLNATLMRDGEFVETIDGAAAVVVDGIAAFGGMIMMRGRLTEEEMKEMARKLKRRPPGNSPKLTYVLDMKIDRIPARPIIKMMRSDHARAFLETGTLRLGSIAHFRQYEHPEIGDRSEGETIMFGIGNRGTIVRQVIGGLNEWIFCCFAGDAAPAVIEKFGYDAAIRIKDPEAFGMAISETLGGLECHFARCVYSDGRVLVGLTNEDIPEEGDNRDIILGTDFADMLGPARAFLKPERYSHQKEFRFTWATEAGVTGYHDIVSPEAASYCELVTL